MLERASGSSTTPGKERPRASVSEKTLPIKGGHKVGVYSLAPAKPVYTLCAASLGSEINAIGISQTRLAQLAYV